MFPDRFHIIRAEDVMDDSYKTLSALCESLGLKASESLRKPSFNGQELKEVYPWGTIRSATVESNISTANELSDQEKLEISMRTWQYIDAFDYRDIAEAKILARK
jgi:hypothetical protein